MKKIIIYLALFLSFSGVAQARSGCCSWHDGVCGCDTSTGEQRCCDGTNSPSCTCQYIPPESPKPQKVNKPVIIKVPSPSVENIRKEINAVQLKYFRNPNGFRERLIKQICDYLGAGVEEVATQVYTMLPDVK